MKRTHCETQRVQDGAGNEARTRYLHLGKVALYRMSYARISKGYITTNRKNVKIFFARFYFPLFREKRLVKALLR